MPSPQRGLRPVVTQGPEAIALVAAIASGAYVGGRAPLASFPLDDAWIHMVYGLAFRRAGMLAYNDGAPATGCTSPLWAIVAGLAHALVGARAPSGVAAIALRGVTLVAFSVGAALAARLARVCAPSGRAADSSALISGLAVATCPVLAYASTSGMEVAIAGALLLGAHLGLARGRGRTSALCAGLAAAARPECALAIPVVIAALELRRGPTWTARATRLALAVAPPIAVAVRNWSVSGRVLPATYYAKAHPSAERVLETLHAGAGVMLPTSHAAFFALVLVAAVVGVARRGRRGLALASCALAGLCLLVATAAIVRVTSTQFYFQRYFAPGFPLLIVAAVSGLAWAAGLVAACLRARRGRTRLAGLAPLAAGALVVEQLLHLPGARATFTRDAASIDAVQVAMGRYVHGALEPGGVVWTVDAGAIRYWGEHPTVDLMRLNSPEMFSGSSVTRPWRASAIVVVPAIFTIEAADGTLERARTFEVPDDPVPPGRSAAVQSIFLCRRGTTERRVIIEARGQLIATGRCAD